MKNTYFFACLFAAVLLIVIAILQMPSPLSDFTQADCIWWLEWDRDIHETYIYLPEDNDTGTWKSHTQWVDDFTEIIARIKREPCKLSKEECIQLLYKAQASHAGSDATDYNTVNWNARWFEAYGKIITYLKSQ
jgi:hypothetical protein